MNRCAEIGKYVYSTKPIGKGAYSKVYKGFNTDTDELIAIKIIEKHNMNADLIQRIYDEISLVSKLEHPHVARLRESLEDDNRFYMILEYCSGGDLSQLIKHGKIDENDARRYMQQLVDALQYLKRINIAHRDLKPHNLLLSGDYKTLKLTDFNFAREMIETDLSQTVCGSPLYMAPEILEKRLYTNKSDLWSVGIILYEMVYARNPFSDAQNIVDLMHKLKIRQIEYSAVVSSECNDLLEKLLRINPELRIDWGAFFDHPWLQFNETMAHSNSDIYTDLLDDSPVKPTQLSPPCNMFTMDIVDDYVPFGVTPPQYAKSEPVEIYRTKAPERYFNSPGGVVGMPSSKNIFDNIWSYMTASATFLKKK